MYVAPKYQQIGHREAENVHGFEAVVGCLAHVAVGAFQDVGAGADAQLCLGPQDGYGPHAHAVEDKRIGGALGAEVAHSGDYIVGLAVAHGGAETG